MLTVAAITKLGYLHGEDRAMDENAELSIRAQMYKELAQYVRLSARRWR
jgi:hypothetical protein